MAKNLKLNIRNAQLAEALNIQKPRIKAPPKAKKAQEDVDLLEGSVAEADAEKRRSPLEGTIVTEGTKVSDVASADVPAAAQVAVKHDTPLPQQEVSGETVDKPRQTPRENLRIGPTIAARPRSVTGAPAEVRRKDELPPNRAYKGFGAPQAAPKAPVFKASASTVRYVQNMKPAVEPEPVAREPKAAGPSLRPPRTGAPRGPGTKAPGSRQPMSSRDFGKAHAPRPAGAVPRSPGTGPRSPGTGPRSPGTGPRRPAGPPRAAGADTPLPAKVNNRVADRDKGKDKKSVEREKERAARQKIGSKGFDARDRQGLRDADDEGWRKRKNHRGQKSQLNDTAPETAVTVHMPITIKELAAQMKLKASQVISKLFMQGLTLTLNDIIDDDTLVQLIGSEFGCEITIDRSEEQRIQVTSQTIADEIAKAAPETLRLRPPVVTFMGHVDHGKTSLIDAIRSTNRVAGEAGAITQHIGAFLAETSHGPICILDTPGHEAFSEMRQRGANVTDIAVLVVAGDEGMRQQTIEALQQAQQAGVQILVAINKCDRPGFDVELVYRQLSEHNLLPEAWGGQTICVETSAVTKSGIGQLVELLALQAELMELRANPEERARGAVLESQMHKGVGNTATILVQNGTLRLGDALVFDNSWAKVKTMRDDRGQTLKTAAPGTPVLISGLSGLPGAGSTFVAVANDREARDIAEVRAEGIKTAAQAVKRPSLDSIMATEAEKKVLRVVVKADVRGSLEAVLNALQRIKSEKVAVEIVGSGVGEVVESDIILAASAKAIVLSFHTGIESKAVLLMRERGVEVVSEDVIYHLVDTVKERMCGLLDRLAREVELGVAEVRQIFRSSQLGLIAGCQVIQGALKRGCQMRVLRHGKLIWTGSMHSLKRGKEDAKEVAKGFDCGILLNGFQSFEEGDLLQGFEIEYITQEL